ARHSPDVKGATEREKHENLFPDGREPAFRKRVFSRFNRLSPGGGKTDQGLPPRRPGMQGEPRRGSPRESS
ncbi:hypothetical protein, partial [Mesorhizobium sp.]|uniref:hypothetical protein n=1 Tax=Mesorhizobium sp. TaxID=1871066 RepID=UPI0025C4547F